MTSLSSFFESDFNTQLEQWEMALLQELKLSEVGTKASRKLLSGNSWPTLSVSRNSEVQLAPKQGWKKASTTYATVDFNTIADYLKEDLEAGVRNFFFHPEFLSEESWSKIEATLGAFEKSEDLDVFLITHDARFSSQKFNMISKIMTGREFQEQGSHSVQELALLAQKLIEKEIKPGHPLYVGVFVDAQFFHSIAKIRAARLLAMKILEEKNLKVDLYIVALTSYQGWTLFERYSNMLRNETGVAASYIGGADHIQSTGYNILFSLETTEQLDPEHELRSRRMARNTSHILALESLLGVVEDAGFGSYHLENLTSMLCEESWKTMQRLLAGEDLTSEVRAVNDKRLEMIKTRKTLMSGINDYPDAQEKLSLTLKPQRFERPARLFEELRLRMQRVSAPDVMIALYGDYAALNARMNFVKNYFELLGLRVSDPGQSVTTLADFDKNLRAHSYDIVVLCASDDHYPEISASAQNCQSRHKFIAGKFALDGFGNLFAGQNIYAVLHALVVVLEGGKV